MTKNPARFDPTVDINASQEQRNIVLDLMLQEHYIDQEQHDQARSKPLEEMLHVQSVDAGCQAAGDAAFFCDYVTKQILNSKEFGKTQEDRNKLLKEGGLDIYTTMDVDANAAAMQAARDTIPVDDPSGFEVTMAAIRPGTGEVLGFGINRIYDATQNSGGGTRTAINYAVDQVDGGGWGFPVGSTWKPINMAAWMKEGRSINEPLRTMTNYNQSTFSCQEPDGTSYGFGNGNWHVENSGGGTTSPETPLQGLIRSHNTTQASMAQQIGLCSIADTAKDLGYHNSPRDQMDIHSANSFQLPMTIGSVQASPLTMANVYATLAAKGTACTPIAMTKVVDKNNKSLKVPKANCHQAIEPGIKYMTTGGFVPQVAAFVTVGNAEGQVSFSGKTINGRSMGTWFGMYIATPAWKEFMNTYLAAANIAPDNDYGNPDPKFIRPVAMQGKTESQRQPEQEEAQRRAREEAQRRAQEEEQQRTRLQAEQQAQQQQQAEQQHVAPAQPQDH